MQEKRKALGRGLEQLFSDENINTFEDIENDIVDNARANNSIVELNLDELRPNPYQPRKKFDEEALNELAASIKEHGVFQPIIVKKTIKGYDIVAGERRFRASKKAGLTTIPAIIEEFSDDEMMQISLLENLQREDLTAIEEAKAYKSIIEASNITQDELAKRVGKSRSHITNILGLLNLPKKVQDMVLKDQISMGHARCLSKLSDPDVINTMAEMIIEKGISVREIEDIISGGNYEKINPTISNKKKENNESHQRLQSVLREKIGTLVKVNKKNIVIPFENDKDLERILEILNISISTED